MEKKGGNTKKQSINKCKREKERNSKSKQNKIFRGPCQCLFSPMWKRNGIKFNLKPTCF